MLSPDRPNDETELLTSRTPSITSPAEDKGEEWLGLVAMAASALAFSIMTLLVKILSSRESMPSFELVFVRSISQLSLGLAVMRWHASDARPLGPRRLWAWLHLRGIAGAIGLALFYFGITALPLSDATVIFFTGPAFTALLAHLALKEPLTRWDLVSIVSCLMGVVLVARPEFFFGPADLSSGNSGDDIALRPWGVLACLLGAVMSAVAYVTVRKVTTLAQRGEVHTLTYVIYFGAWSTLLSLVGMIFMQQIVLPASFVTWLLLIAVGLSAFLGQVLLNRGLQLAPAGPGTVMRNLDVVFAFVFEMTILQSTPKWTSFAGAGLILAVTISMAVRKWRIKSR